MARHGARRGDPEPHLVPPQPCAGGTQTGLAEQQGEKKIISVRLIKKPVSESQTQHCRFKWLVLLGGTSSVLKGIFWETENSLKGNWGQGGGIQEQKKMGKEKPSNQNGHTKVFCFEPKLYLLRMI